MNNNACYCLLLYRYSKQRHQRETSYARSLIIEQSIDTDTMKQWQKILTSSTVIALPSRETNAFAAGAAAVMPEAVVSRPAEILAALAVIVSGAGHPVLVHHARVRAPMLVLDPAGPDVEPSLGRESRDEDFLCNRRKANGFVSQ